MSWKESKPMDQKVQLIADWKRQKFEITDLSQKYGISRKTVYKWIKRYEHLGVDGLKDQSRAPYVCHNKKSSALIDLIVKEKLRNKKRGPKKIYARLKELYPRIDIPAPSTIGYWLSKKGLVKQRKRRLRVEPYTDPFIRCQTPNSVWSANYKGQFRTKDHKPCYPVTISDNYSRYLLKCVGLPGPRYQKTKDVFESAFREYGLPEAIRTDNGTPFAGRCIGALSKLSIWWIQLGIIPERIEKGCPQQNGRHERMHRTLKYEALDQIAEDIVEQQKEFDLFCVEYNDYRPHEALNQQAPVKYYRKSLRPYIENPKEPEYDDSCSVRRVKRNGEIKVKGKYYFVSELLHRKPIGLKRVDDDFIAIYYSFQLLGMIDLQNKKVLRKV